MMTYDTLSENTTASQTLMTSAAASTPEQLRQHLADLTRLGGDTLQHDAGLQEELIRCANQLTAFLRWDKTYDEAIALQEQLADLLPGDAVTMRATAATLRIEAGQAQAGFTTLHAIADHTPDNPWGWITLGTSYLWTGQFAEAEQSLLQATRLDSAEAVDRAAAHLLLFRLYGLQKRVDWAVQAWEQAVNLDPALEVTLPNLLRVLIHWYYFDTAERFIKRESCELRRVFYRDLITLKRSPVFPRNTFDWVFAYDPKALDEGHDEFAEACIRFVKPGMALAAIEPLIDQGEITPRRLVLAGLAWAQQRMVERATWALELAVRVGDLESPRATRRSTGGRRILDTESRVLYGEIIIDPDIREEVDPFFMPVVDND